MSLLYKQEHLSCYNYTSIRNACFKIIDIQKGEVIERSMPEHSVILYIFSGKVHITCEDLKKGEYSEGDMLLVPKNFTGKLCALSDAVLMTCICSKDLKLCSTFSIQKLRDYLQDDFYYNFKILRADNRIREFYSFLRSTLMDGLGCTHFHSLKRDELFLYLRASYGKEELADFFAPLLARDMDFKDFVLGQYKEIHDVKEFAEKANMSLSTFNRRFKETFHEPASKWLLARKAEEIRKDIVMTTLTFSEIAEKYEFSSSAYLTAFCKKAYGLSPNELREKGMELNENLKYDLKV